MKRKKIEGIKGIEINKDQLVECIGRIVPWNYKGKIGEFVFEANIDDIPIMIACKYSKEEFDRMCG